ncbi:MAG: AbrB/MazE/SpoVT family DNA-binding domain-containing protein [Bacillota bacterium]
MHEETLVETVRLGSRCQMVIPARIRKSLGLKEGDAVLITMVGRTAVIVPRPASYSERLMGLHGELWRGVRPEDYVQQERQTWQP